MKNACGDAALSPDMQSRYHDRYQKCQDELAKSEKVYRSTLDDLYLLKKNYVSHMNDVCYTHIYTIKCSLLFYFPPFSFPFHIYFCSFRLHKC